MMLTKGAIGNLINRYSAVLKKCSLINTFGSLAVAGMLVMGGAAGAVAADAATKGDYEGAPTLTIVEESQYGAVTVKGVVGENSNNCMGINVTDPVTFTGAVTIDAQNTKNGVGVQVSKAAIFNDVLTINLVGEQNTAYGTGINIYGGNITANRNVTIDNTQYGFSKGIYLASNTQFTGKKKTTINTSSTNGIAYGIDYSSKNGVVNVNELSIDAQGQRGAYGIVANVNSAGSTFTATGALNISAKALAQNDDDGETKAFGIYAEGMKLNSPKNTTISATGGGKNYAIAAYSNATPENIIDITQASPTLTEKKYSYAPTEVTIGGDNATVKITGDVVSSVFDRKKDDDNISEGIAVTDKNITDNTSVINLNLLTADSVLNGAVIETAHYKTGFDNHIFYPESNTHGTVNLVLDNMATWNVLGDSIIKQIKVGTGTINIKENVTLGSDAWRTEIVGISEDASNATVNVAENAHWYAVDSKIANLSLAESSMVNAKNLTVSGKVNVDTLIFGAKEDVTSGLHVVDNTTINNGKVSVNKLVAGASGSTLTLNNGHLQVRDGFAFSKNTANMDLKGGTFEVLGSGLDITAMDEGTDSKISIAAEELTSNLITTVLTATGKDVTLANAATSSGTDKGVVTLLGDGTNFLTAASLTIGGSIQDGIVNFGDSTNPAHADKVKGGKTAAEINVAANGTLNVNKGDWTVGSLDVQASGNLAINGGTLTVGSLNQSGGSLTIDGGGKLDVGDIFKNTVAYNSNTPAGIDVKNGALVAQAGKLGELKGDKFKITTNNKQINLDDTGTLVMNWGNNQKLNLDQLKAIKTAMLATGSTGLIKHDGATIEIAKTEKGNLKDTVTVGDAGAAGTLLKDKVGVATTDVTAPEVVVAAANGSYGAAGLVIDASKSTSATSIAAKVNENLTLTGENGSLVEVAGNKELTASNVNFTVANDKALNLGSAATSAGAGTIGDVTLNTNSKLNVTNGTFTMGSVGAADGENGIISDSGGVGIFTVTGGTANTHNINVDQLVLNGGAINAHSAVNVDETLDMGGEENEVVAGKLSAFYDTDDKTSLETDGYITVGGAISNSGTIQADNYVSLTNSAIQTIADGQSLTIIGGVKGVNRDATSADGKWTASTAINTNALTVNKGGALNLVAKTGDIQINGAALSEAGGALQMFAKEGKLTFKNILTANNAADIFVAKTIEATDAVELNNGASMVATGTASFGGDVTLTAAEADKNTSMYVGDLADADGASFTVGTAVTADVGTSFLQVAEISTPDPVSQVIVSPSNTFTINTNGSVSFGSHGQDWVKAQAAASGFEHTAVVATDMVGLDLSKNTIKAGTLAAGVSENANFALGEGALLIADVSKLDGTNSLFTGDNLKGDISKEAGLRVTASNQLKANTNYTVGTIETLTQDGTALTAGADTELTFENPNALTTDARLVKIDSVTYETGNVLKVNTSLIDAKTVFPKLDKDLSGLLNTMAVENGISTESNNYGQRFMSRAVSTDYMTDATEAAATIEGAAKIAFAGAAPQMAMNLANAAGNVASLRNSLAAAPQGAAVAMNDEGVIYREGLSAGDGMKNGFGLWVMPTYQNQQAFGLESGEFETGYKSNAAGVALGADYTFNDMFRVGAQFNVGGGYAESSGDFNSTDNRFNYWGLGLYAGYQYENIGVTADFGYSSNNNEIEQTLPSSMQMAALKADAKTDTFTVGLRGEYKFATEALDIVPHIGVRMTNMHMGSFDVKSDKHKVFKADDVNATVWTFPVGVTFSKDIETESGWTVKPSLDLAIVPAAGDIEAKQDVKIAGVNGSAQVESNIMDHISYQGSLGLSAKHDNGVSVGVNYTLQAGAHTTDHGVQATFRYEF